MSRLKIGPRDGSEWAGVRSAARRGRVSRAARADFEELQQAQQEDPHVGLLSDDGRWWWDGQQWAPNLPSPPTRSPRSGGRPRRLRLVAVVLVLAVLVALVAVALAHLQQVMLGAAWVLVAAGVYVMLTANRRSRRSRRRSRGILAPFLASFVGAFLGGKRR